MRWQIQGWMTHGRCLLRLGGPREGFKTLLRSLSTEPESLGFPPVGGSGVELVDKNLEPMQSASVRPHSSNSDSEVWDPQVRLLELIPLCVKAWLWGTKSRDSVGYSVSTLHT